MDNNTYIEKNSYGILPYYYNYKNNKIYFLIGQRKETYNYSDLIYYLKLNSYKLNIKKLYLFVSKITNEEKNKLLNSSLFKTFFLKYENIVRNINSNGNVQYTTFAGRKTKNETDIETALREFKEETGLEKCNIFVNKIFKEENLVKKNGINFKYIRKLYLSRIFNIKHIDKFKKNNEINELKWISIDELHLLKNRLSTLNIIFNAYKYVIKNNLYNDYLTYNIVKLSDMKNLDYHLSNYYIKKLITNKNTYYVLKS